MARVLIIEHDNATLKAWVSALSKAGHSVSGSQDHADGISKMDLRTFDMIVVDLSVRGTDTGRNLLTRINAFQAKSPCQVLVTNKDNDPETGAAVKASRLFQLFPKPFVPDALLEKVENTLNPVASPGAPAGTASRDASRPIDVKFINPVLQATIDAISIMTGTSVQAKTPYVKRPGEMSEDVTGQVSVVSSNFVGTISLSFPEAGYLKMVSKVLGTEYFEVNAENQDFIAELLNMIFGQAKLKLNESGMNIQSAIPQITIGKSATVDTGPAHATGTSPVLVIPFACTDFGYCKVEISTRST